MARHSSGSASTALLLLLSTQFAESWPIAAAGVVGTPVYSGPGVENTSVAESSSQTCIGGDLWSRVCAFRNIVFDKVTNTFVFSVGSEPDQQSPLDAAQCDAKYIQLGQETPTMWQFKFCINFTTAPLPSGPSVCVEPKPTYLFTQYNRHSFGHLLRDNFNIIAWNLQRLGLDRQTHQLLVTETLSDVQRKYAVWVASHMARWRDHVQTVCGQRRYVRFDSLVAGYGVRKLTHDSVQPYMCTSAPFLAQRSLALRLAGLPDASVAELPSVRVLILDKTADDKRRITNVPELLSTLRERFPDAQSSSHTLRHLTPTAQLRYLSSISVLVTTGGSASFRFIYLPIGAQVVMISGPAMLSPAQSVGHPEYKRCWRYMQHFGFHLYNRTSLAETVMRFIRAEHATPEDRHAYMELWDADVVPIPAKLGDLVGDALEAVRALREARPPVALGSPPPPVGDAQSAAKV